MLGKAEKLNHAKNPKATIVAVGHMAAIAWSAVSALQERGIEAEAINVRFVKPWDKETVLESARRSGYLIVVEENVAPGGFGQAVRAEFADEPFQVEAISLPDGFVDHGSVDLLRSDVGLTAERIVALVVDIVSV